MKDRPITVAETAPFIRKVSKIWSDDELNEFKDYIALNPEAGDLIQDTGGIRKVRWGRQGSGKRGGVRVIYFYYVEDMPIYLITLYAKAEREDIMPDEKRGMREFVASIKRQFKTDRS